MKAPHVKAVYPIIKGKSQIADISSLEGIIFKMLFIILGFGRFRHEAKILYNRIFNDDRFVIKMKRHIESV